MWNLQDLNLLIFLIQSWHTLHQESWHHTGQQYQYPRGNTSSLLHVPSSIIKYVWQVHYINLQECILYHGIWRYCTQPSHCAQFICQIDCVGHCMFCDMVWNSHNCATLLSDTPQNTPWVSHILLVQWNPVNPVTNGPQKSGRIKGVREIGKSLTEFLLRPE